MDRVKRSKSTILVNGSSSGQVIGHKGRVRLTHDLGMGFWAYPNWDWFGCWIWFKRAMSLGLGLAWGSHLDLYFEPTNLGCLVVQLHNTFSTKGFRVS